MRLITWNANMAFRKKFHPIIKWQADVLIIQECESKEKIIQAFDGIEFTDMYWVGNNPHKGICTISFNDYRLKPLDYNPDFQYIVPYEINHRNSKINLFSVWAMDDKYNRKNRYIGQVWGAIQYYEKLLHANTIISGDLNSNAIWDNDVRPASHSKVVDYLQERDIISLYHHQNKIAPGMEPDPTFYLYKNIDKPYHLDYCFLSKNLISNESKIKVGKHKKWTKLSDHMPIRIDNINFPL